MITKFLSKLKSIIFKSAVSTKATPKKEAKTTKSQISKNKKKPKKVNAKKNIETLTTLPGVGAKVQKLYMRQVLKQQKQLLQP